MWMPPDPYARWADVEPYGYDDGVVEPCARVPLGQQSRHDYSARLIDPDWNERPSVRSFDCHLQRIAREQQRIDRHMRRVRVLRWLYGASAGREDDADDGGEC